MRILTGIQPSGDLHIANYFGSIKAMLEVQDKEDMFIFIADYHAMTSNQKGAELKKNKLKAAAAFLALGIKPEQCTFWLQSDVKEVLELYWILSQFTPMGLLERAHSFKDKVAKGINASFGLFSYPVLMAADILLYEPDFVPVGKDQLQHLEITRDIALKINQNYGTLFVLPQAQLHKEYGVIVGVDGAKMSKTYKNTIDIFVDEKTLKKQISAIITDSRTLDEAKDWKTCKIFALAQLFLDEDAQKDLKLRYEKGGEGYGHFKAYLYELINAYFKEAREKFSILISDEKKLQDILEFGASKARKIAQAKMQELYDKIGL